MRHAALLLAAALCLSACARDRSADASGRDTYLRYCASCHGPEGRGDGPLAGSLTPPPADLTQLAKKNGGDYDERAVMAVIDGRRQVAAHGSRDMPVWGAIFEAEEEGRGEPYPAYHSLLQSRLLVDYLATLQEK
jgi:mono/diheme cytochrome c family protein